MQSCNLSNCIRLLWFYTSEGRIFSAYLRPWVLSEAHASPHVPLLQDIDISVSDALDAFEAAKKREAETLVKNRRLRGKQARPAVTEVLRYVHTTSDGQPLPRSYANAWKDYRCKHVVSKWAARIIHQFNASHLADSLEAAEAEDVRDRTRDRNPIDNSWMQLTTVKDILQGTASAERRRAGNDENVKISAHAHNVEEAKSISEKLWRMPMTAEVTVDISNKHKSMISSIRTKPTKKREEPSTKTFGDGAEQARLVYGKFKLQKAHAWLRDVMAEEKKPSDEQLSCIEAIISRCAEESREVDENNEFRSEPLRMLLHGVPGAGKTQTLLWIRRFFEEVCGWTHGQEFVFCASQNTMTALIQGVTLHSFFKLVFKDKEGRKINIQNNDKTDISKEYLQYQALRFIFVDEFSTAGIEIFAEINNKTSTHIRKNNTWSLRKVGQDISERPFGGLNLVVSGDAWQFGPIGSFGAVFDNPIRMQCVAANSIIAAMLATTIINLKQPNIP